MPKGHPKDNSEEKQILHQLNIAKGHLEKVIKMKAGNSYCIDIVHQSMAVQAALRKIDQKIIKGHMESCVADAIRKGNDKEVIDEVMSIMKKI
jgi:DNA-binding FrmR family transcriptional regulator